MGEPQVTYSPRPDATPEAERSALAAVYRFLLFESNSAKQKAVEPAPEPDGCDDGDVAQEERSSHDLTDVSTNDLSTRRAL